MSDPNTKLERQKLALEVLLKRQELRENRTMSRSFLRNPLSLAIVGGIVTLLVNTLATFVSSQNEERQASLALQAELISNLTQTDTIAAARSNMEFLVQTGSIPDYEETILAYLERNPGSAPRTTSASHERASSDGVFGTDDRLRLTDEQIESIAAGASWPLRVEVEPTRLLSSVGRLDRLDNGSPRCTAFRIRHDLLAFPEFCQHPDGVTGVAPI